MGYGHAACLKKHGRHWYLLDSERGHPLNLDSTPPEEGWHQVSGHTYTLTSITPTRQLARLDPTSDEWNQRIEIDWTAGSPPTQHRHRPAPPTHQERAPPSPTPTPNPIATHHTNDTLAHPQPPQPCTRTAPATTREKQTNKQPKRKQTKGQKVTGPMDAFVQRTNPIPPAQLTEAASPPPPPPLKGKPATDKPCSHKPPPPRTRAPPQDKRKPLPSNKTGPHRPTYQTPSPT